jgi:hypothetical protein
MKYLIILTAVALFYYTIGAFIYSSFNSALWEREGKIALSLCYGMTAIVVLIIAVVAEANKTLKQ